MLTPRLFDPLTVGGIELKNRITMPPMHTNLGNKEDGIIEAGADFYIARARGGFSLIGVGIIDSYFVEGAGSPLEFFLDNARHVKNYARLVAEVKKHDCVPYAQIGVRRLWPVKQLHRDDRPTLADFPAEKIPEMITAIADTAERAAEAGFPAVDILGVGGSAHSIFVSQVFNNRTDEWGGSEENRLRFSIETVRAIKKRLGEDFPVFYRLHGSEFLKGGYGVETAARNAQALEAAGVAFFNVTGGGHATSVPQLTPNVPRNAYAYLAGEVKKAVSVPVAAANRNNDPIGAEAVIRNGWADMISLGRQALADADWPVKAERGDIEDIRLCVACNECLDITVIYDKPVYCLVNPKQSVMSELDDIGEAAEKKKVAVIGGGVAGLQFALTAAERGHSVTLFEKKNHLGGMWNQAAYPRGREELFSFLRWLTHGVKAAGVDLRMNTEADEATIAELAPDVVAVSAANEPDMPDIPGIDGDNVLFAARALDGDVEIGEKVVIIGGGGIGAEIAPHLAKRWTLAPEVAAFLHDMNAVEDDSPLFAQRGHDVTLTTRQDKIGGTIGESTRWVVNKEVRHAGIKVMNGTTAKQITPEGVIVEQNGKEELLAADTVLVAGGLKPSLALFESMKAAKVAPSVLSVGNSDQPTHAVHNLREAFRLALEI